MKPYEKPVFSLQNLQNLEPYNGTKYGINYNKTIDGVTIDDIVKQYGTPVFVISENQLRNNYLKFSQAFKAEYENFALAYSYKTNYLNAVCLILKELGAWSEVVSSLEYEMAKRLDVEGNKIVFNGCLKKPDELKRALLDGAIINVDSHDEAIQLEKIAIQLRKKVKVGLRINMSLSELPWSKFGLNLESGQAYNLCRRLYEAGLVSICGLHAHIGTYIFDPILYGQASKMLTTFASRLEDEFNFKIEYFDLGGGFPSPNTLQMQFLPANYVVPDISSYAKALTEPIKTFKSKTGKRPLLITEPGRAVVDSSTTCFTSVVSTKMIDSGAQAAIVDVGISNLPTTRWYDHEVSCLNKKLLSRIETVIFGPLCMQLDIIRNSIKLPPLHNGDLLMIKNTGAYNITQSNQFIFARPPIVLVKDGQVELIRKKETLDDIQKLQVTPQRFLKIKELKLKKAA
ncbi:MAG: diaminopimelate decarboxylase [Deltaproteobacteria bacterium]|nr:diaminopimelate decarboxylase [Deltaproteobacteria bacterium]